MSGLSGDFHVAPGANFVFQRDDSGVSFTRKEAFEAIENIFIDAAGDFRAFFGQAFELALHGRGFRLEVRELPGDGVALHGHLFVFNRYFRFQFIPLVHELEFLILDRVDFLLVTLNLIPHRAEFLVLPRFVLLGLEAIDAFSARADVEFQLLSFYFELTRLALEYKQAVNVHLDAVEHKDSIVFLHAVEEGPASQSYGLQVAALAGVPKAVIKNARKYLQLLEDASLARGSQSGQPDLFAPGQAVPEPEAAADPARELLDSVNPDELTPREALELLYRLKRL